MRRWDTSREPPSAASDGHRSRRRRLYPVSRAGVATPAVALRSALVNSRTLAAVALGGIAGAAARWWMHSLWPDGSDWWVTLIVNAAGSAVLGWLVAGDHHRWRIATAFGGAGFCGSFTTFSAFSVIVAGYFELGRPGAGLLYAAASLGSAIAAAVLAGWGRRLLGGPHRRVAA